MHFDKKIENVLEVFDADEFVMSNSKNCIKWNAQLMS